MKLDACNRQNQENYGGSIKGIDSFSGYPLSELKLNHGNTKLISWQEIVFATRYRENIMFYASIGSNPTQLIIEAPKG